MTAWAVIPFRLDFSNISPHWSHRNHLGPL